MYRAATFSANTQRTYKSQLKSYLDFCSEFDFQPVPTTVDNLCMYAAHLSHRLKPSSINQYLNIVRLIHIEVGYENPLDNWMLKSTLKGIRRLHGDSVRRKEPITPAMLLKVKEKLDLNCVFDAHFWAACLVLFFGTFRKSNLFPDSRTTYDSAKQFRRADFVAKDNGDIYLSVRWSKTIQCKERSYVIKLPYLEHSLSPATAVRDAFGLLDINPTGAAFVIDKSGTPMSSKDFSKQLKSVLLRCGYNTQDYTSHSFRRGSAVWAMQNGLPTEIVKYMGDWKSSVYLNYIDSIPKVMFVKYCDMFCKNLPND